MFRTITGPHFSDAKGRYSLGGGLNVPLKLEVWVGQGKKTLKAELRRGGYNYRIEAI